MFGNTEPNSNRLWLVQLLASYLGYGHSSKTVARGYLDYTWPNYIFFECSYDAMVQRLVIQNASSILSHQSELFGNGKTGLSLLVNAVSNAPKQLLKVFFGI